MEAQRPAHHPCSPSCQTCPAPPFSVQPLHYDSNTSDAPPPDDELLSLLPASYRTRSDNLVAASRDAGACVEKELDLRRLTDILDWLWLAGRPTPPRSLHHQILLSWNVLVTERLDMHLVWTTGWVFIKPIPRFLLEPRFWTCHLLCAHSCRWTTQDGSPGPRVDGIQKSPEGVPEHDPRCKQKLRKCALGFLFSYAALITHETDFSIAKEKLLLPPEVSWPAWRALVHQLDTEHIYSRVDPRFVYGELRLGRLNKMYYLWKTPLQGYMPRWQQYGTFFQDYFAWLASATVYIVVVLTAMQVGLETNALGGNDAFQSVSSGFTVFSILAPFVAVGLVIVTFCCQFAKDWTATVAYRKERFHVIDEHNIGSTP